MNLDIKMVNTQNKLKAFPTDSDFDKVEYKPATKWADLPHDIYRIDEKRAMPESKYGESMIITLTSDSSDDVYEVWAPSRIMRALVVRPNAEYLRNNGMKASRTNKGNEYYSFELL